MRTNRELIEQEGIRRITKYECIFCAYSSESLTEILEHRTHHCKYKK